MKYYQTLIKEMLINIGFELSDEGIAHNGRFWVYQSYDLFPNYLVGVLIDSKELRFVVYDNQFFLFEENRIFLDAMPLEKIREYYDNNFSILDILNITFKKIKEMIEEGEENE